MIAYRIALTVTVLAICATPARSQQPTHNYVIVHGAWGGGWDWRHVDSLLTASGNNVYRPTLTGLGERVHLMNSTVDLSTHITDIVNVIRFENLRDVVLVGHSYGGMVISGVVDRIPDRIRHVVYLDAFVPEDGESVLTAMRGLRSETFVRAMVDSAKNDVIVPSWVPPGATPPSDVPQPKKAFSEPLRLQNPAGRRIPATYILTVEAGKPEADDDFAPFSRRAKSRGWTHYVLQADHTPERSAPQELTALLRRVP
ncbi:MAG: alpha/beta fold hydrolase [Gemmatimonadota bacterium]|nr:alpha/beta fold hydrolase [Gemmatimonadota bacterium]